MEPREMTKEEASALADLQFHWDEWYVIRLEHGLWSARWLGDDALLTAPDAVELRELLRVDYASRQHAEYARLRERMTT